MKTFFRILDDQLYGFQTDEIGFSIDDPSYMPDDVLESQRFMVMRTCHGIGDWVLLSSMPRLLKLKYPNCKVYVPSKKLMKKIFGDLLDTWGYGTFDASTIPEIVFKNNPYVDDFVDEFKDEIFHDHYKIFNSNEDKIPLVEQMIKFWQFTKNEIQDTTPDFYLSAKEKDWFNEFNDFEKYGYILTSSSFGAGANPDNLLSFIKKKADSIKKWYYYGEIKFKDSLFNFLDKDNVIEIKPLNLSIRQQQILKVCAEENFGNETGMNLWTSKYSKCYVLQNLHYSFFHGGDKVGKIRERPFKSGNYVEKINYI